MEQRILVPALIILFAIVTAYYILESGDIFAPTQPTSDQLMYSAIVLNDIDPAVVGELCNKTYLVEENGTTSPNSGIFVYVYPRIARPLDPEGYLFGAGGVLHNSSGDWNDPLCFETDNLYDSKGKYNMSLSTCGLFANETLCIGEGGRKVECPKPANIQFCSDLLAANHS